MNGSPSRNHEVSFVVSASTICRVLSALGRERTDSTYWETSAMPSCRAIGSSRASTRYSLPGWSTIALSLCTSARTQSKLVAVRVIACLRQAVRRRGLTPARWRVMASGMRSSGRISSARPACAIAPGMPQTTEVASSCTRTVPPAARTAAAPAAVGAHAGQHDGQNRAVVGGRGRAEQGVHRRAAEVLRRALVQPGVQTPCRRADDEVVVAGRQVDGARDERAAVGGLDHPQGAEPVQPLGELAGEDGRHVLHDQDRHRQVRRQHRQDAGQGLGPAGGGADDQDGGLLARAGARGDRPRRGRRSVPRAGRVTGRPVSALIFGISCSRTLSIDWLTLPTFAGLVT